MNSANTTLRNRLWRPALTLVIFAVIGSGLVVFTEQATREKIQQNQTKRLALQLANLLPPDSYDNQPLHDRITPESAMLASDNNIEIIFRARLRNQPTAVIIKTVATPGYVAPISLLIGIDVNGQVTGIQPLEHRETPGLGDKIDPDKSDWINSFAGLSLHKPAMSEWSTRRDGGAFDQITGATVTSRAIISSIQNTLKYFDDNRTQIFSTVATKSDPDP